MYQMSQIALKFSPQVVCLSHLDEETSASAENMSQMLTSIVGGGMGAQVEATGTSHGRRSYSQVCRGRGLKGL